MCSTTVWLTLTLTALTPWHWHTDSTTDWVTDLAKYMLSCQCAVLSVCQCQCVCTTVCMLLSCQRIPPSSIQTVIQSSDTAWQVWDQELADNNCMNCTTVSWCMLDCTTALIYMYMLVADWCTLLHGIAGHHGSRSWLTEASSMVVQYTVQFLQHDAVCSIQYSSVCQQVLDLMCQCSV